MTNRMAERMATAMANRMAKPMRFVWQNYAPNPNPNPNPNSFVLRLLVVIQVSFIRCSLFQGGDE